MYGSGTEKNFGFGSGIGYPLGTGEQLQAYVRVETFDVTLQELEFVLDGLLIEPFLEPHGGGIGALPLVELVFLFTSTTTLLRILLLAFPNSGLGLMSRQVGLSRNEGLWSFSVMFASLLEVLKFEVCSDLFCFLLYIADFCLISCFFCSLW